MKLHYYLFLFILSTGVLQAETSNQDVAGGIVINESLQKLMDVPGVQAIYDGCSKNYSNPVDRAQNVLKCVWDDVSKNPGMKKQVQAIYASESKTQKEPAGRDPASSTTSNQSNLTGRKLNVGTNYETDPAVIALSDFYGKKLAEILDPNKALRAEEIKKGVILSVDHSQFIDLYKSELGKTIISAFTSYCMDTDPAKCDIKQKDCSIANDENTRIVNRKKNLENLKKADLNSNSEDAQKWKICISSVSESCEKADPDPTKMNETGKRSCLIMDYVKSARKNIIIADQQKKYYDELAKTQTTGIVLNTKNADPSKTSTDTVLEITKEDVKIAMEKPLNKAQAEIKSCYENGTIINIEACKKYLNSNPDANLQAVTELGMRQMAQEEVLKDELNSPDKVAQYLKEEGYTPNQITEMTKDKDKSKETKDEILKRYAAQKAAIIAEMANRIDKKSTTVDGKIDANSSSDKSKIEKISTELGSRSSDLQNLVYFNNVVSSYLEITDGSGKTERNTASLFAEVDDMTGADGKDLKDQIKKADLKQNKKNEANTTDLNVDTINKAFLKYSTQKD